MQRGTFNAASEMLGERTLPATQTTGLGAPVSRSKLVTAKFLVRSDNTIVVAFDKQDELVTGIPH